MRAGPQRDRFDPSRLEARGQAEPGAVRRRLGGSPGRQPDQVERQPVGDQLEPVAGRLAGAARIIGRIEADSEARTASGERGDGLPAGSFARCEQQRGGRDYSPRINVLRP